MVLERNTGVERLGGPVFAPYRGAFYWECSNCGFKTPSTSHCECASTWCTTWHHQFYLTHNPGTHNPPTVILYLDDLASRCYSPLPSTRRHTVDGIIYSEARL